MKLKMVQKCKDSGYLIALEVDNNLVMIRYKDMCLEYENEFAIEIIEDLIYNSIATGITVDELLKTIYRINRRLTHD